MASTRRVRSNSTSAALSPSCNERALEPWNARQHEHHLTRSEITLTGQLRLSIEEQELAAPGPDEVVVRIEAAPINSADLAELLGPADVATLTGEGTADRPITTAAVPQRLLHLAAVRAGKSQAVGLGRAGMVIDAGANAQHLLGGKW